MTYATPEPSHPEEPPSGSRRPGWLPWLLLLLVLLALILFGVSQCGNDDPAPVGAPGPTTPYATTTGPTTEPPTTQPPTTQPPTTQPPTTQPPITTTSPPGGGETTPAGSAGQSEPPPNRVDAGSGGRADSGGRDLGLVLVGLLTAASGLALVGLRRRRPASQLRGGAG